MPTVTYLPLVIRCVRQRFLQIFVACTLPLLVTGCSTPTTPPLPAPGAGWESHTGQLHYRVAEGRSVIGEVVVRHSGPNQFALSFLSGPGFPLLKLQVSGDDVVAEGALARGRWSGKVQNAPKALRGWIGLREVFAQLPASLTTGGWSTEVRASAGKVQHVVAQYAPTGERFALHFGS